MSSANLYAFHARSYYKELFVESYGCSLQFVEYAPFVCDYYQIYDHNINSYPHVTSAHFQIKQIKQEMENYIEFIKNNTSTLLDQSSKWVKGHVEHLFHETDLSIGCPPLEDCLVSDFESPSPMRIKFQVDTSLCDFEDKNDIFIPLFLCVYPFKTNISIDNTNDVLIICNSPTFLVIKKAQ